MFDGLRVSSNKIEFVTINSLIAEFSIRSLAGPDKTGCVQQAYTSLAPLSFKACAAKVIVPAVSIMSSIIIAVRPSISPTIFITSATFGLGRRLSIIAIGVFKMSASLRARVTPPWSGDTTTHSSGSMLGSFSKC